MVDPNRRRDDDLLDERAIREDERIRMEQELRTLDADRHHDVVDRDTRYVGDGRDVRGDGRDDVVDRDTRYVRDDRDLRDDGHNDVVGRDTRDVDAAGGRGARPARSRSSSSCWPAFLKT